MTRSSILLIQSQRMFASCYAGNRSPQQRDEEKLHCNPIYRRLGGRKTSVKGQQERLKDESSQIQQSIINGCDLSGIVETRQNLSTVHTKLSQSVIMPQGVSGLPTVMALKEKPQAQYESATKSQQPLEVIHMKYNELQAKYIGALQRTNNYLEKELERSRVYSQTQSKSQAVKGHSSNKKVSSELIDLKNRLNNIDFSNIKKFAGVDIHEDGQKNCSNEDKENMHSSVFRQLRSKIQ